ncbi:MAG: hypothetical protein QW292_04300 [Candidatus Parvarchaeota archaeon]
MDNFSSHDSKLVAETAELLNVKLVFIAPYFPEPNLSDSSGKVSRELYQSHQQILMRI